MPPAPPEPPVPPLPDDEPEELDELDAVDDELEEPIGHIIIGFWQTQASLMQQPSWRQPKQASVQVNSSHGPPGGTQVMPVDELAMLALADMPLEAFDELTDELVELEVVEDMPPVFPVPEPVVDPDPVWPPAPPVSSPSPIGDVSVPVAQLAATVTEIPSASSRTASLSTLPPITILP